MVSNTYTIGQQKALRDAQDYYEYCASSEIRKEWLKKHNRGFNYYNGKQWENETLLYQLEEIGCKPETFNYVKPIFNDILSIIIRSGKRVGYSSEYLENVYNKIAEYLKSYVYNFQTQNNHKYFSILKIQSALISGIGFSNISYEKNKLNYDYVDAREIFIDPDDMTPRLENSNVICRSYFVNKVVLKNKFPKEADYFDQIIDDNKTTSDDIYSSKNFDLFNLDFQTWTHGKSIRVVEVFHKKEADFYETTAIIENEGEEIKQEHLLQTFYKDLAERKSADGNIEVKKGTKIYKTVFTENCLLFNGEITEQIPNQKYFPIIPMVFRRDLNGMPLGVMDDFIPLQDKLNELMTTSLHYSDSSTIFVSGTNVKDNETIRNTIDLETKKKAGLVLIPDAKDITIKDNKVNLEHRLKLLQEIKRDFQVISRIYDDFAGKETNRVSGVAINASTTNNLNSQNFLMLSYEHMLTSEGRLILDILKGVNNLKEVFSYFKQGESEEAQIDESIAMINFEVYPENSPNFSSNIEEEKAKFAQIINSPSRDLIMKSPLFLQESGMTDKSSYKLAQEYMRVIMEQLQMQQGLIPNQAQDNQETTEG